MIFLLVVDMNPSNITYIYSTLLCICKLCLKIKATPMITFDLPLFLKALMVIDSTLDNEALKKVVLRLGSFHTIMSFIGSIRHFIAAWGLEDLLNTIYTSNTIYSYVIYVHDKYKELIIVFDDYESPSTKDHAHVIRQKGGW